MLAEFLTPPTHVPAAEDCLRGTIGATILRHTGSKLPDLEGVQLALIGVKEGRSSGENEGTAAAPDPVRGALYALYAPPQGPVLADLGNIAPGHTEADTHYALQAVVGELLRRNILPIVIGGGHELTFAHYRAYEGAEQMVDLLVIDDRLDLETPEGPAPTPADHLHRIALHEPYFLFNMAIMAHQVYLCNPEALDAFQSLYFDSHRLGEIRDNIEEAEPIIRQADMVSFDISAVRGSEAPGNAHAGPNGLMAHEACQLVRYAGMSDKLSSIGFYNYNPALDPRGFTAQLVAQLVWFVLEGFGMRVDDFPAKHNADFMRFIAFSREGEHEIVFYKSRKSGRWWMEVPAPARVGVPERIHIVPCNFADYQTATKEELPDKWWRAHQKYM